MFEKHAAEREESIEIGHIPPHAWSLNPCRRELFTRTLNRAGADEIAPLLLRAIQHARLILLKIVDNCFQARREVHKVLQVGNHLRDLVGKQ